MVLGTFADPPLQPQGFSGVGEKFTQSLRQKLAARTDLVLQSNDNLIDEVAIAVRNRSSATAGDLKSIARRYPQVRYAVVGKIIDFKHVALTPSDLSQWSAARNRNQAIATVKLDVVDFAARRIVLSTQIDARAWADQPADQTYRGVSFGSHRFWETPLGLAMRDAVSQSQSRIDAAVPRVFDEPIRVVRRINDRRVRLSVNSKSKVSEGDVLYLCAYDSSGTNLRPVVDATTRQPLKARIESRGLHPSAWLLGQPAAGVDVAGSVLVPSLSSAATVRASSFTAASP